MPTPYEPPEAELVGSSVDSAPSNAGAFFAVVGSAMSVLIFVGLGLFLVKMYQMFQVVSLEGAGDPKLMAGGISSALVPVILFGVLSSFGLIISIATMSVTSYRKRWFFIATIVSATAGLLFFPIGTAVGLVALIIAYRKRQEFRNAGSENALPNSAK